MTDILTRLAALTIRPCAGCQWGWDNHADCHEPKGRDSRESALIALVQEAAAEIERLRKEYSLKHDQYNSTLERLELAAKRIEELDPPAPGWG